MNENNLKAFPELLKIWRNLQNRAQKDPESVDTNYVNHLIIQNFGCIIDLLEHFIKENRELKFNNKFVKNLKRV